MTRKWPAQAARIRGVLSSCDFESDAQPVECGPFRKEATVVLSAVPWHTPFCALHSPRKQRFGMILTRGA